MRFRFLERRAVWWPTRLGWLIVVIILLGPALFWWFEGESLLSQTNRLPAEALVIESWIGIEAIHAAAEEFANPAYEYRYIVVTGGLTASRWEDRHWSYTEMAKSELIRAGVAEDRIIVAPSRDTETQRTFESSAAVRWALHRKGLQPKALNVFTLGAHASRSRLVFAKVLGPQTEVGVVSWIPQTYENGPWWKSSERAKDLMTESVGFVAEALFNSGRSWSIPAQPEELTARADH